MTLLYPFPSLINANITTEFKTPKSHFLMYLKGAIKIISDEQCLIPDIVNSAHTPPNQAKENI